MSFRRILAMALIFAVACAGWSILGTTTMLRSEKFSDLLGDEVEQLWGSSLIQEAPSLAVSIPGTEQMRWIMPSKNEIAVELKLDYRRKGLVWYPTYKCDFKGTYTITNNEEVTQKVRFLFNFPDKAATYEEFGVYIDDVKQPLLIDIKEGVGEMIEVAPHKSRNFRITYKTRGLGEWRYRIDKNVGSIQGLNLVVNTDFTDIDYPQGGLSAMKTEERGDGKQIIWKTSEMISSQDIGIVVPERLNPGPVATRITFFAPVCLLFFFVLIATISIIYKINIHPMHYLFVAAGFFAFHLLLAYLVDHIDIHLAFAISSITSMVLVTMYLASALGANFPWRTATLGQAFYLILFSYSFFLEGITGLTVAIGSVVTLAVLMKVTASTDWEDVFSRTASRTKSSVISTEKA